MVDRDGVLVGRDRAATCGIGGVGVMGLIVAGLPLIALVAGYLPMDIHGFGGFVLVQSLWYLAIAAQLVRGRM